MKLEAFAESLAIKVNKEEDFGAIEAFKFDILGYRASIIARLDPATAPEIYYQYLTQFKIENNISILKEKTEFIKIPKLIAFKNNKFAIKAFNRIGGNVIFIDVIDEEQAQFVKTGNRFTKNTPRLVYSNNTLIPQGFNLSSLNGLTIAGIFNNPIDVINSKSCSCIDNQGCTIDGDLDIEDSLYQQIVVFMYKQLGIEQENQILPNNQ